MLHKANAAFAGHLDCIKALIAAHADKRLKNVKGQTALDCAIDNGYTDCADYLRSA